LTHGSLNDKIFFDGSFGEKYRILNLSSFNCVGVAAFVGFYFTVIETFILPFPFLLES
jgi:hypothetical protein